MIKVNSKRNITMNMENNQLKLNNKKEIRKSQPKNIKD